MLTFPFTKKKFDSLDSHGKFKWTVKWLEKIHLKVLSEDISEKALDSFRNEYLKLLSWQGIKEPVFPETKKKDPWIEFISDSVNFHRNRAGFVPKEFDFLPKVLTGDDSTDLPWQPSFNWSIALDGLRSVFNVGSIIRVCDCAGFASVILGNTPGDEHRGVKKVSMGTSSWIPQESTDDLASLLNEKRNLNIPVIGVETIENSVSYTDYNWSDKGIIVFGNEEYGLSEDVIKVCDDFVHIPMSGRKNSLNVANAVSVIAFHIGLYLDQS